MGGIFISYRREDTAGHAGRIFDRLKEKFGQGRVFMDVAGIEPGVDFVEAIDQAVGSCDVLLVIIGKKWLTCTDALGNKRLDDPKDFIRLETATALRRDIRVIPVLVQDALMPGEGDLPDDLKKLARRQATEIDDTHWDSDTGHLIETLVKVLPGEPEPARAGAVTRDSAPAGEKREHAAAVLSGSGKNRLAWILSSVAVVITLLGGLFYFSPSDKAVVPDLVGISLDEAVARLEREHLRPGNVRPMPSDRMAGSVIEQDPAPGSQVPRESPVNLMLAEKPPENGSVPATEAMLSTVPKLVGQPLERAYLVLEKAGLRGVKASQKETSEAPEGTVIEQSPKAGTKLPSGESVELVIAVSPAAPLMVMAPDVTGMDVKRAISRLKEAGLRAEQRIEREETTKAEAGTVLKQSLRPGSRVDPNEVVTLVVAVAPRDGAPASGILLPDFTGSPVAKVEGFLREAGLVLGPVKEKASSEHPAGAVIAQRPPAKTRMEKGGTVILVVAVSAGERPVFSAPEQIWPEDGRAFDNFPRTTTLRWKALSGAASYSVEVDCLHCCVSGKWCSELGRPWKIARDIPAAISPGYKFEFAGAQPGRWRVWAVDKNGREGVKSQWRTFRYTK